jgi:chromosome segregation ATPase
MLDQTTSETINKMPTQEESSTSDPLGVLNVYFDTLSNAKQSWETLKEKLGLMAQANQELKKQQQQLKLENHAIMNEYQDLKQENQNTKMQNEGLKKQQQESDKHILAIEAESQAVKKEMEGVMKEYQTLQRESKDMKKQTKELVKKERESTEYTDTLERKINELNLENQVMHDQIQSKKEMIQQAQSELNSGPDYLCGSMMCH